MQQVQFSGAEPFVLDDDVADALLGYALALAHYRRHDLVRFGARDGSGALVTVTLLIGPHSDASARTTSGGEPVGDRAAADDLQQRSAQLTASSDGYGEPDWIASRETDSEPTH